MAKRFINTDVWQNDELLDSTPEQKILYFFVITQCSNIGVFKMSLRLVSMQVGFDVNEELILSLPVNVEKIGVNKYWLPNFCQYQYGELKETCKPHKRYMDDLKKEGLLDRVMKGYTKGMQTLEEKDKDKEEEKEEEKTKKKKFTPPTIEELKYWAFQEKLFNFDCDHYFKLRTENDWKNGKGRRVQNWKLDARSNSKFENYLINKYKPVSFLSPEVEKSVKAINFIMEKKNVA